MPSKKRNDKILRISTKNYAKLEKDAKEKNVYMKNIADKIIEQYYYNEECKIDHRLESFIFEQNEKLDKHLSSIAIKNAQDTCTVLAALMMLIKNTAKNNPNKDELEEQIMLIGRQYFEKHWRYKKDKKEK